MSSVKIQDNKLWKSASEICAETYSRLTELREEEKFGMAYGLRLDSYQVTKSLGDAFGAIDPRDKKYFLGKARSNLFAVSSAYRMAQKVGELKIVPETMVAIDKLIDDIDSEIEKATKAIPAWFEEMTPKEKK